MTNFYDNLKSFFDKESIFICVNTITDLSLLCINPEIISNDDKLFVQFESLNDKWWTTLEIRNIHAKEEKTLYIENEEDNIIMFQPLDLYNYDFYIKKDYFNAPSFENEKNLIQYFQNLSVDEIS